MLIIKKISTFVFVLVLVTACNTASLKSSGRGVNAHPALWEATGGQGTVYLLGSVHALPSSVKWYGKKISRAFDKADELVLETIYMEDYAEAFNKIDRKYGLLDEGKVISEYLTKVEYLKYKEIVKQLNLNQDKLDRAKPWLFFVLLGSIVNEEASKYGVDRLFHNEAKVRGIKVSAVETVYQQMEVIASEPFLTQLKSLKKFLNTKKVNQKDVKRQKSLLVAWINGDVDRAAKLLAIEIPRAEYNNLIIKRNNLWYPKIKSYFAKKQTTMIVVGLAHLVGRGNIINKLKRSGYKVKRVQ